MSNRKCRQYTLMHSVVCFYIKTELGRINILSVSMEHILINCTLHWLYTNVHVQCKSPYKYIKILHISLKLRPQDIIVLSPRRYYWTSYKTLSSWRSMTGRSKHTIPFAEPRSPSLSAKKSTSIRSFYSLGWVKLRFIGIRIFKDVAPLTFISLKVLRDRSIEIKQLKYIIKPIGTCILIQTCFENKFWKTGIDKK